MDFIIKNILSVATLLIVSLHIGIDYYNYEEQTLFYQPTVVKSISAPREEFINHMLPIIHASNAVLETQGYKPIPPSLVLAQTIIESNWGKSRFAREANNLFGVHSFNGKGMKPLKGNFIVRVYDNHYQSIMDYMIVLHKGSFFKGFQGMIQSTKDPMILADTLIAYSERREVYIDLIKDVIKSNDLTQFDI